MRLIGYTRVSTEQQGESGLGQAAQEAAINRYCEAHGHEIVLWENDVVSSRKDLRVGWQHVQDYLVAGLNAEGVIVAKLDRISRSVKESAEIFEQFKKYGWNIVALDLGVDTSTPAGKMVAGIMACVAEWERDVISERTTEALAVKKANGDKLGRPYNTIGKNAENIMRGYAAHGIKEVIQELEYRQVVTPSGGFVWYPSTVKRHMRRLGLID